MGQQLYEYAWLGAPKVLKERQLSIGDANICAFLRFPCTFLVPFVAEPVAVIFLFSRTFMCLLQSVDEAHNVVVFCADRLLIRSHPELKLRESRGWLAAIPLDLGRYAAAGQKAILGESGKAPQQLIACYHDLVFKDCLVNVFLAVLVWRPQLVAQRSPGKGLLGRFRFIC